MGEYGSCRSCRAQVYWARSAASGKPMPLEEDSERGNVVIDEAGFAHAFRDNAAAVGAQTAGIDSTGQIREFGAAVYISHHATCPAGPQWRDRPRAQQRAPAPEALF